MASGSVQAVHRLLGLVDFPQGVLVLEPAEERGLFVAVKMIAVAK